MSSGARLIALACMVSAAAAAEPSLTIEPLVAAVRAEVPAIPWVAVGDQAWHAGGPLFSLSDPAFDTTARGWIAVSSEAILWHVVVVDDQQVDAPGGGDLWNGDALQLAIDSLGDASDEPPAGRSAGQVLLELDDADYCVARVQGKPTACSFYHGLGRTGAKPGVTTAIARDDGAKTTTYDVAIPWSDLGTAAGLAPTLKVALQVNDSDPGRKDQQRLVWGGGLGSQFVPALFHRLALGPPPAAVAVAYVSKPWLTGKDASAEILLACTADQATTIDAAFAGIAKRLQVPAAGAHRLQRFAIRGAPGQLPAGSVPMSARLSAGGKTLAAAEQRVFSDSAENWYAFAPTSDTEPSVIGMADWLEKPAGKHGFVQIAGKDLVFEDGTPMKFWGVGRHGCKAPPKQADATALAA